MNNPAQSDINSSDIEFEAPSVNKQAAYRGQASITELIKHAGSDRLASKRTVVQLQFGHGAPATQYLQTLWIRRFNTFREHTLKQSLTIPFTGDDMLRFFDSVIGKVKPRGLNKHVPNDELVTQAFKVLCSYGEFTWDAKDGYQITRRDGRRLQTFIDDAVKANRLIKGAWHKRTWIGFATLSRMVRSFLEHWHAHGCWGWDVVIGKCLSVVLVAALGSRSGDVARSAFYKGTEYVQWRHVDLYLEGGTEYVNLRAIITLESTKGHKDVRNEESIYYLRPLDDVDCQHVCPIALLMVHALRNGMVSGSTLQEVLDHAAATPARRVVWTRPHLPVLSRIGRKPTRCDFTGPAHPNQLRNTIKDMGLISNILARVYMHATRLGAARDSAHLPRLDEGFGYCTDEIRQRMGHRPSTTARGTTEAYVGGPTRELYNARAANKAKSHRREPKFSEESAWDAVKAPVTKEEVRIWRDKNESPDREGRSTGSIQQTIRLERLEHYQQTATPETPPISKSSTHPTMLASISPNQVNTTSPTARVGKKSQRSDDDQKQSRASIPDGLTDPVETHHEDVTGGKTIDYANIDPALLDDSELERLQVHQGDLDRLEAEIFPTMESSEGERMDQAGVSTASGMVVTACNEDVLFEESGRLMFGMEEGGEQITLTAEQWIDRYARINVVQNQEFVGQWAAYSEKGQPFESTIGQHSVRGHSRDNPTPWVFCCRKTDKCTFQCLRKGGLEMHEAICNQALVEAVQDRVTKQVMCTWEGCHQSFHSDRTLRAHVRGTHEWQPKPCEHGCESAKILYQNADSYRAHQQAKHSGRWPCRCSHPECMSDQSFNSINTLKYHLRTAHGVTDPTEQVRYIPLGPPRQVWVEQRCVGEACSSRRAVWDSRARMLKHLISHHQMTEADANRLIDERAPLVSVTPPVRVKGHGPRSGTRRKVERELGGEDEEGKGDENEAVGRGSRKKRKSG